MTKKDLVKIIREVVRSEVKKVVQSEMNEVMNLLEQKKMQSPKSMSLNEAIDHTRNGNDSEYNTIGDFKSDMRAQFAGMQEKAQVTDINNRPVDVSKLDPALTKALTRDYSALVKRF